MSNNCLHTQLKSAIENDNLPVLGMIKLKVKVDSSSRLPRLALYGANDLLDVVLLDDGVTFTSATSPSIMVDSKHGKVSKTYGGNLYLSGASEGDWINVGYSPKYDVTNIGIDSNGINLADLSYITGLVVLTPLATADSTSRGKLEDLSLCTALTSINITNAYISGDISALGGLTSLVTLGLNSNGRVNCSGNFADFVSAQKSNGRSSCDGLALYSPTGLGIGFGNKPKIMAGQAGENATMKWSGSKISLQWDTSKVVYTIGYTQAEAETAFPTYTVELCG